MAYSVLDDLGFRVQGLGFRFIGFRDFRVYGARSVACYPKALRWTPKRNP